MRRILMLVAMAACGSESPGEACDAIMRSVCCYDSNCEGTSTTSCTNTDCQPIVKGTLCDAGNRSSVNFDQCRADLAAIGNDRTLCTAICESSPRPGEACEPLPESCVTVDCDAPGASCAGP